MTGQDKAASPVLIVCATPAGLCCNCGDEGIVLRGEQPILNADGVTFCSVECADEYDTRVEHQRTEWCPTCGYDRHEHAPDCTTPDNTDSPGSP